MAEKTQPKIIALVGMTGSGKSVAGDALIAAGCAYIRFGQITIDTIQERGLPVTPETEKSVREELRHTHGMGAFATLNIPKFDKALAEGKHLVADGLYSWTEYKILKDYYGERLTVLAIYASPATRYARLEKRITEAGDTAVKNRPLTAAQARARDFAEIENIEKGGPIVMADFTIVNEKLTIEKLKTKTREIFKKLL